MVKLIYCINRKPGMSVEEFQRYWREVHGPIAARIPGLRRYVQCHVVPERYEGERPVAYDGAAELWFDNMAALRAIRGTPESLAAIEDEKNFIDHSRVFSIVTEEKPVVE
jgi:uncharacterized protein (TIGR02118 family)